MKAKKLSNWIWERSESNNFHKFTIITDQRIRCKVDIKSCLPCTCSYLQKEKKVKNTCEHIAATLLTNFKLPDNSILLSQVAFTQNEVEYFLDKLNANAKSQQIPKEAEKTTINLSFAEQQLKIETNEGNKNVQKWFLEKLTERKGAKCCAYGSTMPKNKLYICIREWHVYSTESNLFYGKEILFLWVADMHNKKALHEQHDSATMKNNYVEEIKSRR